MLDRRAAYDGIFPGAEHDLRGAIVGQKRLCAMQHVVFVDSVANLTKPMAHWYRSRLIRLPTYDVIDHARQYPRQFRGLKRLSSVLQDFGHPSRVVLRHRFGPPPLQD